MNGCRTAIAGATGLVGEELIGLLEERRFPVSELRLLASPRSAGRSLTALGRTVIVENLAEADPSGLDLVFFCAGAERSLAFAPAFAEAGAHVIDNSSAFRDDPALPLVVPEVNGNLLETLEPGIIANPNCSTIIALLPLAALHRAFGLDRVLVSTYQAVSGAGRLAVEELMEQTRVFPEKPQAPEHLPRTLLHNLIPWIGAIDESGFCHEEQKMVSESRKILGLPDLAISATTVRVPVARCHALAIWVRVKESADLTSVRTVLEKTPGLRLEKEPPCPGELAGTDPVHVGRVRPDPHEANAYWLFAVSDQVRKGAALNAVQIAERLVERKP